MDDGQQVQNESGPTSFIVKIWPEEKDKAGRWATWRGHITHVPSGVQRYFENLNDIATFIKPYLETMGISLSVYRRAWIWLKRTLLCWDL